MRWRILSIPVLLLCLGAPTISARPRLSATTSPAATQATTQPHPKNPPNIVDHLAHVDTADAWSQGTLFNANVHPDSPARIILGYRESAYPRLGTWTGPEVETKFDFTDLIASFNPSTPEGTGIILEIRVNQAGAWSPWLYLQSWGKVTTPPDRDIKFNGGAVDIDQLILDRPAQQYQARITLMSFAYDVAVAPSVRRLSVCYSGVVPNPQLREKLSPPTTLPTNWARDLHVPYRSQGEDSIPKSLHGLICSPTSTSMVLEFFGQNFTTVQNAEAIYDPHYDMFGNWGRAVSRAGELGLDAWLTRFRNWDQVKSEIAAGSPVVASIRFKKGQVKGLLYEFTLGHLIVIRGFTATGDVIVNDPANRAKGNGIIYPASELAKAWFDNGGVGYIIHRPQSIDIAKSPTTAPVSSAIAR